MREVGASVETLAIEGFGSGCGLAERIACAPSDANPALLVSKTPCAAPHMPDARALPRGVAPPHTARSAARAFKWGQTATRAVGVPTHEWQAAFVCIHGVM